MTKRTITLLALAFTLAGAGTADAATQPSAPTRAPAAATPPTQFSSLTPLSSLTLRTVRFVITNKTGDWLHYLKDSTDDNNTWRQKPADIPDGGVGDYTVTSSGHSVGATMWYSLPGHPGYGLAIGGENPLAFGNSSVCDRLIPDSGPWAYPVDCSIKEDKKGYNDTNFYVTVTDRAAAAADHTRR